MIDKIPHRIQTEILTSVTKTLGEGKIPHLTIKRHRFYILPKIKFVRRSKKKVIVEKTLLAKIQIDIPFTIREVKRSRSWLGDGMQQDDINCFSEWVEKEIVFNTSELKKFIDFELSKLDL